MLTFIHTLWANKDVAGLLLAGVIALLAAGYLRSVWPCLIALPVLALAVGIIVGDVRGFREGASAAKTVVAALESANVKLSDKITQCRQSNEAFAQAAKVSKAELERAKAQLVQQHQADLETLTRAQAKIDEAIHANKDTAAWAAARVPDSVVRVLAGPG